MVDRCERNGKRLRRWKPKPHAGAPAAITHAPAEDARAAANLLEPNHPVEHGGVARGHLACHVTQLAPMFREHHDRVFVVLIIRLAAESHPNLTSKAIALHHAIRTTSGSQDVLHVKRLASYLHVEAVLSRHLERVQRLAAPSAEYRHASQYHDSTDDTRETTRRARTVPSGAALDQQRLEDLDRVGLCCG